MESDAEKFFTEDILSPPVYLYDQGDVDKNDIPPIGKTHEQTRNLKKIFVPPHYQVPIKLLLSELTLPEKVEEFRQEEEDARVMEDVLNWPTQPREDGLL
jgi:hypothetical protein